MSGLDIQTSRQIDFGFDTYLAGLHRTSDVKQQLAHFSKRPCTCRWYVLYYLICLFKLSIRLTNDFFHRTSDVKQQLAHLSKRSCTCRWYVLYCLICPFKLSGFKHTVTRLMNDEGFQAAYYNTPAENVSYCSNTRSCNYLERKLETNIDLIMYGDYLHIIIPSDLSFGRSFLGRKIFSGIFISTFLSFPGDHPWEKTISRISFPS